jgi:nucleotide-binding universal stress UspA family protein
MLKKIMVAVDGSDHAGKAVSLASDLAAKNKAQLILIHVLLTNARSETLHKVARRSQLTKKLRDLLDNYEADFVMAMGDAGAGAGFVPVPPPQELVEAIADQIVGRAENIARKAGVKKINRVVISGDAADGILACAASEKVDMIVLGSRGLSDFKGLILGSVSHKVSAQSGCTCVTVK